MQLYFVAGGSSVVNSESYLAQVVNSGKLEFYNTMLSKISNLQYKLDVFFFTVAIQTHPCPF